MKRLMFIVASLFLVTSIASASPSQQMDFTSMNKAESQFLFDGSTKAIVLSNQEMKDTEGEWLPLLFMAIRFTPHVYRYSRAAIGPLRSWVRFGRSYSKSGGYKTTSIRWGSNNYHRQSIGSSRLKSYNSRLHNSSISSKYWRTRDTGHFHFRRY